MTITRIATESEPSPRTARYLGEIEAIKRDAVALASELSDVQANWQPSPSRWSVAQCLSHIVLSAAPYLDGIRAGITEAKRRTATGQSPYRQGILANWLARSLEPPPRLRAKTFRRLEPPPKAPIHSVLGQTIAIHDELAGELRAACDIDLDRGRMRSPFARVLRLTIDQAVRAHLAHTRRHLWQAWQVRKSPRFPGG